MLGSTYRYTVGLKNLLTAEAARRKAMIVTSNTSLFVALSEEESVSVSGGDKGSDLANAVVYLDPRQLDYYVGRGNQFLPPQIDFRNLSPEALAELAALF